MIDKKDILNNEKLISKEEAYKTQIKQYENILFKYFLRTEQGQIFNNLSSNIKEKYSIKKRQKAVIDINKIGNIFSSEHNFSGIAFIHSFKFNNHDILTLTSSPKNKNTYTSRYKIDEINYKSDIYIINPYNQPFKRISNIIHLHN